MTEEVDAKIAAARKARDEQVPEGMTKSQWKKMRRRAKWDEEKEKFKEIKRIKRRQTRANRKEAIKELVDRGDLETLKMMYPSKSRIGEREPLEQTKSGVKLVIDCSYDDYMLEKEVVSLSSQVTRAYADNRRNKNTVDLLISSFNKRLKDRFETSIPDRMNWDEDLIKFTEKDLDEVLPFGNEEEMKKVIFLSADTEDELEDLKAGETYIIGGIVDKGRHKNLCETRAQKLGIQTKRLPIDKYIQVSGRRVLATSHVVEILIKFLELRDWKLAFEAVLPSRKLMEGKTDVSADAGASPSPSPSPAPAGEHKEAAEETKAD